MKDLLWSLCTIIENISVIYLFIIYYICLFYFLVLGETWAPYIGYSMDPPLFFFYWKTILIKYSWCFFLPILEWSSAGWPCHLNFPGSPRSRVHWGLLGCHRQARVPRRLHQVSEPSYPMFSCFPWKMKWACPSCLTHNPSSNFQYFSHHWSPAHLFSCNAPQVLGKPLLLPAHPRPSSPKDGSKLLKGTWRQSNLDI